jgi:hypothetical protein
MVFLPELIDVATCRADRVTRAGLVKHRTSHVKCVDGAAYAVPLFGLELAVIQ